MEHHYARKGYDFHPRHLFSGSCSMCPACGPPAALAGKTDVIVDDKIQLFLGKAVMFGRGLVGDGFSLKKYYNASRLGVCPNATPYLTSLGFPEG